MAEKILVTREIPEAGLELLHNKFDDVTVFDDELGPPREKLIGALSEVTGLISLLTEKIDAEVIAAGTKLKVIANYAVGFDNVDVKAATARRILVTNTPGVLTDATAEMAWALLFSTARRIVEADKYSRAGKFKIWGPKLLLGGDLAGRTLGIIGAGRIGDAMARKSIGFNMKVLYADAVANEGLEADLGARRVSLDELLREADFVSVHVPLLPETKHLISSAQLKMMKPTAYLINTSRGPVVDEAALVEALASGEIAGAGLDVYEEEPKIHPGLMELDNVVLAPHIASATIETRSKMATMAAQNLIDALEGRRPQNLVNPEVWE